MFGRGPASSTVAQLVDSGIYNTIYLFVIYRYLWVCTLSLPDMSNKKI